MSTTPAARDLAVFESLTGNRTTTKPNAYEGRFRWWYTAIADLMIAEPHLRQEEIAFRLNRHPNTINMIVNTDLFRTYLSHRKAQFREQSNEVLTSKMTAVATGALDLILERMEKKRDQIPFQSLESLSGSMLDKLGYGVTPVGVQINQTNSFQQNDNRSVVISASPQALEEARQALRLAEARRGAFALPETPPLLDMVADLVESPEKSLPAGASEAEAELPSEVDDALLMGSRP